jgi:hypothetical protein
MMWTSVREQEVSKNPFTIAMFEISSISILTHGESPSTSKFTPDAIA